MRKTDWFRIGFAKTKVSPPPFNEILRDNSFIFIHELIQMFGPPDNNRSHHPITYFILFDYLCDPAATTNSPSIGNLLCSTGLWMNFIIQTCLPLTLPTRYLCILLGTYT
jgi:hypothetical protein